MGIRWHCNGQTCRDEHVLVGQPIPKETQVAEAAGHAGGQAPDEQAVMRPDQRQQAAGKSKQEGNTELPEEQMAADLSAYRDQCASGE